MVTIPYAPFEPDKSPYNMGAITDMLNAIPVADGWGPVPSPSPLTPALDILTDELGNPLTDELGSILVAFSSGFTLDGEITLPGARGGIFYRLPSGTAVLIVGTETALYRYNFTEHAYEDISGPSAPYNCEERWSFAPYGNTIYCQDNSDPEQMYNVSLGGVFADNTTAPICRTIAVVADFMFRFGLASDPTQCQWSALDDPTSNAIGVRLSDVQPFGEGGAVLNGLALSSGALVALQEGFEIMNYPDPEYTFRRTGLTAFRGLAACYSLCSTGQDDFVAYCTDGFYRGLNMQPIGAERVDRWFLNITDEAARAAMFAAPDFRRKVVWFHFNTIDGTPLMLGYDWQLDRWCLSRPGLVDIFKLETVGLTIDGLGAMFDTFDDINVPFNSSLFDGGSFEFGGINENGELAYLNGDPLEAMLPTNEASLNGMNRAFVNGGTVLTDAANHSVVLSTADRRGGIWRDRAPVTPSTRSGKLSLRGDGMLHKASVTIPSQSWTIFSGIDVDPVASGKT